MSKSITLHFETIFTKVFSAYRENTQGQILQELAKLIQGGHIKNTATTTYHGLTAENIKLAHTQIETGGTVGKIIITTA